MLSFLSGLFLIAHGLVYLLYAGHARRMFELRPGLSWPDGSWAFSKTLGDEGTRSLVIISYGLVALAFVAGGIGSLAGQGWWRPVVIGAAVTASALILLFWDGKMDMLDAKGGIGLLINLVILAVLYIV
jgi:hypothetical protein